MGWRSGCWGRGRGWDDGFVVMKRGKQSRRVYTGGLKIEVVGE